MNILLTNDDSHDSPLFLHAIELLRGFGDITVVVPAEEQSWKGKSMTRFGELYVDQIDIHGTLAFSVTGTPADCVNLAIYNLMDARPDIVVSGINLGINTGLGFVLSSGTLGACFEANVAGIPGLALSQELSADEFHQWNEDRRFSEESIADLRNIAEKTVPIVWKEYVVDRNLDATTWNVNLPCNLHGQLIVRTRLGQTFYNRCFSQRGDQYFHDLARFSVDPADDTDEAVVRSGHVSVTEIDLTGIGQAI